MAPMSTRILYSSGALRATMTGQSSERVMFTFDHWRRDRRGMAPPPSGTPFTTRGFAHIHVSTARNDWFLAPDLAALLTTLAGVAAHFPVRAGLGFSMGGFGLFAVSRAVPLTQALFVSPQTTCRPDLPQDHAIGDRRFPQDLADPVFACEADHVIRHTPPSDAACVVLFDPTLPFDARHAAEVARGFVAPRLVPMPGAGHPVTDALPPTRAFGTVARAACAPGIAEHFVTQAFARFRRDPTKALLEQIRPKGEEADEDRRDRSHEDRPRRQIFRNADPFGLRGVQGVGKGFERGVQNLGDPDQRDHGDDPAPVVAV